MRSQSSRQILVSLFRPKMFLVRKELVKTKWNAKKDKMKDANAAMTLLEKRPA